jgi:hypothetical protein
MESPGDDADTSSQNQHLILSVRRVLSQSVHLGLPIPTGPRVHGYECMSAWVFTGVSLVHPRYDHESSGNGRREDIKDIRDIDRYIGGSVCLGP